MLLLAVAVSAVSVVPPQTNPVGTGEVCPRIQPYVAVQRGKAPPMKKLNELPPGNLYKAVYRRIDGCEVPVVVRYDIGRR